MDLSSLFSSMSLNESSSTNIKNFAAKIGEFHTEFVVASFTNENLLIISQYNKLGTLYKVFVDQPGNGLNISDPVYTVKSIFGNTSVESEATARYIAEQLAISKPLMVFLNLKDYSRDTVVNVVGAIKNYSD